MLTIKSRFPSYVVYRIHGKTWYAPRWDRELQNTEWIGTTVTGYLIMRTQTLSTGW